MAYQASWNRRRFLRLCSGGAACITAGRAALASDESPPARFTLAIGTYTFRSLDIAGLAERCRELKVPVIELSHPQYMLPQAKVDQFPAVRDRLSSAGIRLASWYCGHLTKRSDIDALVQGVRVFGVKMVSGSAERELLDEIDRASRNASFAFGIHNHYFAGRKFTYESAEDVLSALKGRTNLFATLDTGHMIAVGIDPSEAYRKLKPHVRIIHLKDEDRPGHCVPLGKGKANIERFLRTVVDDGFAGLGAIEFEEGTDPKQEVAECVDFIRSRVALG